VGDRLLVEQGQRVATVGRIEAERVAHAWPGQHPPAHAAPPVCASSRIAGSTNSCLVSARCTLPLVVLGMLRGGTTTTSAGRMPVRLLTATRTARRSASYSPSARAVS